MPAPPGERLDIAFRKTGRADKLAGRVRAPGQSKAALLSYGARVCNPMAELNRSGPGSSSHPHRLWCPGALCRNRRPVPDIERSAAVSASMTKVVVGVQEMNGVAEKTDTFADMLPAVGRLARGRKRMHRLEILNGHWQILAELQRVRYAWSIYVIAGVGVSA
ncbi:hypothetical protein OH77DRAFT_1205701 [Trametes cingulata]|nr:hypothetical protein OH77DRAFT_1205701 [Trametes cingulata]